ncbi:hypothetical protein NGTWS0302_05350 [Mycolicibacterium cyprinidarum]|uniref:Methyltransferase type 12 domain-containing protein n=1 Tax=Mycolicibacterium cyprinidarum TaxID=2860311 RepID=A0ABQ4VBE0_9MYCO|nr:hypothetical protein NGTWS0302_05350 [Mycolicibacterium sp. NGTWS0302]GJF17853.1 hypothetical protein NGTWS1702_24900 [Mycolicibacterium sp. NGTWSNA01]
MGQGNRHRRAVEQSQDAAHGTSYDYTVGSPHLRHASLRTRIDGRIAEAVSSILQRQGVCSVLEVGAGHGSFTDTVLDAGGTVTVTEMSKASFDHLAARFHDCPAVRVVYDENGDAPFIDAEQYDVILLISVIHHIPDYLSIVTRLCDTVLRPGGIMLTFQDPLWYPRQKYWERCISWTLYFAWRVTQGEFRRGVATRWRRLRGVYSETESSDLVEYHVVRQGVDDLTLTQTLSCRFDSVDVDRYFSTQSPPLQSVCEKFFPPNTFGIVARDRR